MAFIIKDRVKEGTTTTGTGAITLSGASATFDPFSSYMADGDTTYYAIVHTSSGVDEWEVGLGTWNTGNTLTRTTVLAGSNGTSVENFSAGTKDIFMTYPAAHAALAEDDVTFANISVTGTVDGRDVAADGTKLDTVEQNADLTDAVNVAAAGALMKSGGTMTGNLVLNADPNAALGAATKQYVDTIASAGIHYHTPVRAEHPSNLNATYNNGSSGVGATLTNAGTNAALVIDNVSMALNDRVLVANQTNQAQNGVYTVTTVGNGSTAWVLTRSTDTDTAGPSDPDSFGKGDAFFIKEGDTNAGHLDVLSTSGTIVFGTTNIVFSEVAETTVYSGGTGITLTGTTFSIGQDVATTANVTFNQVTADIIGNVTGNVTGDVTGNADTATALETARTIQLTGDVTGSASFDGSANATITAVVQDDSHSHVISNVDGLQSALDGKTPTSRNITAGNGLTGGGNLTANRTLNVGAGSGISVTADAVAHADTSSQASVNNSGRSYIQDITLDGFGHVTGLTSATETVTDTTYTAGAGLALTGTTFSHTDTSSQASVNNSNGTVIQDITLDTYGHITGIASTNLDGRYYTETEADSRFVNTSGDTMTGTLTIDTGSSSSDALVLRGTSPTLNFIDEGSHDDFYIHVNSNNFYVLRDAAGADTVGTGWDSPFPLVLEGDTNIGYLFGNRMFADNYHPNADRWTTSRTLSLSGDASGSVSWDGSANATLSVTVNDGSGSGLDADLLDGQHASAFALASHNHDGRYYTESEADSRFVNVTGDTMTGTLTGPTLRLTASGDASVSSTSHAFQIGSTSGNNIICDTNEIMARSNGSVSGLNLNPDGGNITIHNNTTAGVFTVGGNNVFHDGYHPNADKWTTSRTLSLSGDASGSVSWDGSANATLSVTVNDDSHTHKTNKIYDARNDGDVTPNGLPDHSVYYTFTDDIAGSGNTWDSVISVKGWTDNYTAWQLMSSSDSDDGNPNLYFRRGRGATWGSLEKIWTSGNDGSGSGLDADLLDGLQSSSYYRNYGLTSISNYDTLDPGVYTTTSTTAANIPYANYNAVWHAEDPTNDRQYQIWMGDSPTGGLRFRMKQGGSTGWHSWEKVWTNVNDGSGSGLDADKLDGAHMSTTRNSANTIPRRDGNGYLQLGWINTTSGNTTSTISDIYVNTNGDGYIRKATPAHFRSQVTNGYYSKISGLAYGPWYTTTGTSNAQNSYVATVADDNSWLFISVNVGTYTTGAGTSDNPTVTRYRYRKVYRTFS